MKITVNGEAHEWSGSMIDYGAVLAIAGKSEGASVTYSGPREGDVQRSGILDARSQPIAVEDGMNFAAHHTGNA
jgi:hypothetical protein